MINRLKQLRFEAPSELRTKVTSMQAKQKQAAVILNVQVANWVGIAFGIAAALVAVVWSSMHVNSSTLNVDQEVVSSHVRSLMSDHLFDIASTDKHTVKPWFSGKLDFSPQVIDLAEKGFPLVGGRLDYIANRPVAALIYRSDQHVINVLTWPMSETQLNENIFSTLQGFNMMHWTKDGMSFYAISDLNANSLANFVEQLRKS